MIKKNKTKVKIIQYGLGSIGLEISQLLLAKQKYQIVAAIDINPKLKNLNLGNLIKKDKIGVLIRDDSKFALKETKADIVILTTNSSLKAIYPQLEEIIKSKKNVISTCEELVYPSKSNKKLFEKIDKLAKANKVTVLGAGVNPGFLMDFLPLVITTAVDDINTIHIERIINASKRREAFQAKIGVGLKLKEFKELVKQNKIKHHGLNESFEMLKDKLELKLDKVSEEIEPIIKGQKVIGIKQSISAYQKKKKVISLVFKAALGLKSEDRIQIKGKSPIDLLMKGGVHGDRATAAIIVNLIPKVLKASPGLKTMLDL